VTAYEIYHTILSFVPIIPTCLAGASLSLAHSLP